MGVFGWERSQASLAFGNMPEVRLLSGEPCYPHSLPSSLFGSLEKEMSSGLLRCMPEACRKGVGRVESQLFYISTIT